LQDEDAARPLNGDRQETLSDTVPINGAHVQQVTAKKASILDNIPENRAERLQILLKNLPNEDLQYILDAKIPNFLRIDKDVQLEREKLADFFKQYMEFDIEELDKEIMASLAMQI